MLHVFPWKDFYATPCLANPSLPVDHHQIGSTSVMVALESPPIIIIIIIISPHPPHPLLIGLCIQELSIILFNYIILCDESGNMSNNIGVQFRNACVRRN